jgi:hypothetical protein
MSAFFIINYVKFVETPLPFIKYKEIVLFEPKDHVIGSAAIE